MTRQHRATRRAHAHCRRRVGHHCRRRARLRDGRRTCCCSCCHGRHIWPQRQDSAAEPPREVHVHVSARLARRQQRSIARLELGLATVQAAVARSDRARRHGLCQLYCARAQQHRNFCLCAASQARGAMAHEQPRLALCWLVTMLVGLTQCAKSSFICQ